MLSRVILNRVTLSKALLNGHNKNTNSQAKKYTVDDLIQLGYLTAYGNENEGYRIDTAQPLPMPIKDIKDFDAVFIGRSVPVSVDTQRACMFNLSNKSHLTESQQKEIISKYNNKPNDRAISQLLFRNYTLPNADLKIIQNKTTDDSWQYSHKMFEGSTFNNVELNIKGSISSTNKLFMGITCNELEIYANSSSGNNMVAGTDIIAPHDTTEMFASSAINKYPRGVSYYRGLANWTFTNNWNGKATEIPNVRGVETEEERITSSINVMKLPSGILYQTLWITSITRIGPVLDVTNVTGSEYLWGNCGIQLPNVTDIRIKGLNNLDWDFRGGATDKAYIPKMDEDSIIYCLNNVVEQTDTTRNIYFSTEVIKPTYEENSAKLKAALSNANTKGWNVYCGDTALIIPDTPPVGNYIQFEDAEVERVLMSKGVSSDGVGITMEDAEKVTSISTWFKGNTTIQTFDELRYFTRVTSLSYDAFVRATIKSIDISNVSNIGGNAFLYSNLEGDFILPKLTAIEGAAFRGTKIKSFVAENLISIPNASGNGGVFHDCKSLTDVSIPSATFIGKDAFVNATSLTSVEMQNVETIGKYAFKNTGLTGDLILPKLNAVGSAAFRETKITSFVAKNLVSIEGNDGGGGAFFNCPILAYVELEAITSIGSDAFAGCSSLKDVIIRAITPPALGAYAFNNSKNATIYVPDASLEAYKTAVNWSAYADRIHPLSEIEGSPYIHFEDAEVERVLMANGVSSDGIGITKEDAASVTSISTWFKGNTAMTSFNELKYFTGVTELSASAMQNCSALVSANLDNIQYLRGSSLNNTGIDKMYLPSVKTISGSALSSCKFSVILLGKNLTNIENYAIRINSILHTAICLATTPPTFGSGNFTSVNALTSVYVPDASVETYKTASGWSGVASKFKGISQLATDNPTLYAEIQQYL